MARKKMRKFSEGGEAARSAKINKRYDRKVADIKSDYDKALAKGKDSAVAKAKYEQRMADAADDRAKWTGGDRTQTRAAEKAAEKNLSMTRKYGPRSSDTQVAKAESKLEEKAPLSSVDTSSLNKKTSFKDAFRAAREKGLKVFPWNGKSYTTQLAGQSKAPTKRAGVGKPADKPASGSGAARQTYASLMAKNFADREKAPKPAAGSTSARTSGTAPAATPTRNIDRFNLGRVQQEMDQPAPRSRLFAGEDKLKAAQERAAAAQGNKKGGKVKKFNKGGSTTDPRRAVLGSDKDIVNRGNRTPYEPIPKTGPDKPKKPLGRAGKAGFKSGGSVMKKGADGVAKKGHTKGKMPKMAMGGVPGRPALTGLANAADRSGRAMPTNAGADARGRAMTMAPAVMPAAPAPSSAAASPAMGVPRSMTGMKKGGKAVKKAMGGKAKCYAKGGSIDGIAKKGKTRCKGMK